MLSPDSPGTSQERGREWPFWLVALVAGVTTFATGVVIGVLIRGPAWRQAAVSPFQSNLPPDLQAFVRALGAYHDQHGTLPSRIDWPVLAPHFAEPDRNEGPSTRAEKRPGTWMSEPLEGPTGHPAGEGDQGQAVTRPAPFPAVAGADLLITAALIEEGEIGGQPGTVGPAFGPHTRHAVPRFPVAVALMIANAGPDRADDVVVEIRMEGAVDRLALGAIEPGGERQIITTVDQARSPVVTFRVRSSVPDPAEADNEAHLRFPQASFHD